MASLFADARRAARRRPQTMATAGGVSPAAALLGGKPADFTGYGGGRPINFGGSGGAAPPLYRAGTNPLVAAMLGEQEGGIDLTAQAARAKDPRAQYRREARRRWAEQQGLADNDWRTWDAAHREQAQEMGILPGRRPDPERVEQARGAARSLGSQLANIRWHGNPDGPSTVESGLAETNALRQAMLLAARRPGSRLYASTSG